MVTLRDLTGAESAVFHRLLRTIRTKERRNLLRTQYRESKNAISKIGPSIPKEMHDFATVLGWADKAITVPASRIKPQDFTADRQLDLLSDLEGVAVDSKLAMHENMAIESALQHSCSFVFTTAGRASEGEPDVIVSVRSAVEATATRDRRTDRITEALELLSRREAILYVPGLALHLETGRNGWQVKDESKLMDGHVPCEPYVWRRTLQRPFGYSRISRPLMGMIDNGVRTLLRQEANAEWYSAPRMAMYGARREHFTNAKGEKIKPWSREIGAIFGVPDIFNDDTGEMDRAKLEQFAQATFQPHTEMTRQIAMLVSGETSIPVGYLGIVQDNPSSADAIRASETDMMTTVVGRELPQLEATRWGLARNILIAMHGEWTPAMNADMRRIKPHMIDGATDTPTARADSAQKFASTYPQFAESDPVLSKWGFSESDIAAMRSHATRASAGSAIDRLLAARQAAQPTGQPAAE